MGTCVCVTVVCEVGGCVREVWEDMGRWHEGCDSDSKVGVVG